MRFLYSFILYLLTPVVILRLVWQGRDSIDYLKRWKERFGFIPVNKISNCVIWIHAVSVGEIQAARPLINLLFRYYPDHVIVVTTTTLTGARILKQHYGNKIVHYYFPYDLPGVIKRFIRRLAPKLLIILETEIWPNLIHFCHVNSIPIALVNARMSELSAKKYKRLLRLTQSTIKKIDIISAQSDLDAERFVELGADNEKIHNSGNLKFDIETTASIKEKGHLIRQKFSPHRPVWIAASTHPGEEELLLQVFSKVLSRIPDCLLVIVPRHPERANNIQTLCNRNNFNSICKSREQAYGSTTSIFILDTLGELPAYYSASDVAFVGGSLVPVGGHNLLEPASLGLPIITGPYLFNFSEISQALCNIEVAWIIGDLNGIANKVIELLLDAELRLDAGDKGRKFVQSNIGNANKTLNLISNLL